ncbi:MAG: PAS domain S-box protein [Halomonadaceae bacterium]|nr:MAG: PAS domain S-box protein [Halomonadaceae bacterium]
MSSLKWPLQMKARLQRLIHGQQRYHALFADYPDAIFRLSPQGQVVEVNARATELTGQSQEQMLGHYWQSLVNESDRTLSLSCFHEALQGESCSYHCQLEVAPGHNVFARVTHVPVSGLVDGVFCIVRDRSHSASRDLRLHQSREELRRLNRAQDNLLESERRRIARDLHDQMGQTLTALKLDMGLIIEDLPHLGDEHIRKLEGLLDFVDETIDQVREISANLRPAMLDELGFEAAAEWFLQRCKSRLGLNIQWSINGDESDKLDIDVATALFRVLQECITNVSRHAAASEVQVHYREEASHALLSVKDNGVGFDVNQQSVPGIGLLGMRERVAMLSGTLTINSMHQQGTTIMVSLPLGSSVNND